MKQQGMTLLEVMVALVIFALAGLTVLKTTAQQANSLSRLEEKTLALWIAENQQAAMRLEKQWPQTQWVDGEINFAGSSWFWRIQGVATADPSVRAVDVEVRHDRDSRVADAVLRSYQVNPGEPAR
ncbi:MULTISPECIES: type II secretion system minor pseudopilin GspI [Dickeya]|uniref:Type II secretion system protein I n=1 Tax=Dickeya aquatica TaxID=1401087 RepID=A0A375A8E8_9GAMM|nr:MULTISPECIES: type II secretion system minor pseudopilin GspI [Dickeya]SLM62251.1 General secretion pathway protein I [Dickeya aquatica]